MNEQKSWFSEYGLCTDPQEQPLDRLPENGGYTGIFKTIACVGDSLAAGEMESLTESGERGYHDMLFYSWGQYIARMTGSTVYTFARGGMTASEYCNCFAAENGYWDKDKACQAYIIALGDNDLYGMNQPIGSTADIDPGDWRRNAETFAGYMGQIIQRYAQLSPKAKFFLITLPRWETAELTARAERHQALMYELAAFFDNTYVIDLRRYAPAHDKAFCEKFFVGGHMNAAGYQLSARMIASYVDYIIRHDMKSFKQTAFIGTPYYNAEDTQ